jgi:hypothetical protein
MRAFAAVPVAIVCVAAPAFANAQSHVTAARKAEHRGEWRKALREWKAAYAAEMNAEYLIGIGDAYAHLGNTAQAKKNYEAYLNDPLALPANVQKVKAKLTQLEAPGKTLSLPGLPLPGAEPPSRPAASAATAERKKAEAPLTLPGLDLPADDRSASAPPPLPMPGAVAGPAKKEPDKVATSSMLPPLPLPGAPAKPDAASKEAAPAVAAKEPAKAKPIAIATPPPEKTAVPIGAVEASPMPREPQGRPSGIQRTMAYVTAGVAVAALSGGAYAFTQANSAHNDVTGRVHSGADAQALLATEQKNRTLSYVGFAGGLVAAGIAAALFAF